MDLNDFLSLIQLAAGLNAAYIVVGISQGYTHVLLNKIFNIKQQIDAKFEPIKSTIRINQETLEHTTPSEVNGVSTYNKIEKVKRDYEIINKKIDDAEKDIKNKANCDCEFRCFSGLSLMMFLYCCALLFIAPFCSEWFLLPFTVLVLLHSVIGWFAENAKLVCSLMWVIGEFVISLVLSGGVYAVAKFGLDLDALPSFWGNLLIIVSALLPMVNFVIFFIKSLSKMKSIRENINTQAARIEQESITIHRDFDTLQRLEELKIDLGM